MKARSKKNIECDTLIDFYCCLMLLFDARKSDEMIFDRVMKLFKRVLPLTSFTTCSPEFLRELLADPRQCAEAAFQDLARYMRIPRVQLILRSFMRLARTDDDRHIYLQIVNRRLLGQDLDGPAVVTIAVHSYKAFRNLGCIGQEIHTSCGDGVTEI